MNESKDKLVRIVRMVFREEEVDCFLKVFESGKHKIRNFEGCLHLELWQDYSQPNVFSTYSEWDDEAALDKYRHSDLFAAIWKDTKVLFQDKPLAFSFKRKILVS